MEIALLLLVLVFLIFILKALNRNSQISAQIQDQLDDLKEQLKSQSSFTETKTFVAPDPVSVPLPPKPESVRPLPVPQSPDEKKLSNSIPFADASAKASWFAKWLRDTPDIEKFIGENLINKVGFAVLVLGISFFVKYAIDQEWINKTGRVCIGLFCGMLKPVRNQRRSYCIWIQEPTIC
ncbi:MAG: DUF2339 domain-containing protein [Bacteroidota bacterium]|nr:DUF2339 domain-containing protein [Bacteroidota bacterium]MDP4214306.1 DUF2339 domain-containing protein [Bacteroidota bacterium]